MKRLIIGRVCISLFTGLFAQTAKIDSVAVFILGKMSDVNGWKKHV